MYPPSRGGNSEKYGNYYGDLIKVVPVADDIIAPNITMCGMCETGEFITAGVKETYFDVEMDDEHSDTLFFETDNNTNYPAVMVMVTKMRPDEFDEITPNCFRMWFD